ncbi:MAG: hypothetical protein F6K42_21765 [Leptolyngbya sp. SIO1D8]|nr:hypothetical protein [Leptolyngbya sp. SIO1D8]
MDVTEGGSDRVLRNRSLGSTALMVTHLAALVNCGTLMPLRIALHPPHDEAMPAQRTRDRRLKSATIH